MSTANLKANVAWFVSHFPQLIGKNKNYQIDAISAITTNLNNRGNLEHIVHLLYASEFNTPNRIIPMILFILFIWIHFNFTTGN